jgi:DNA-binding CsgD family transcriptional regulator/PAS domain-containing protein
VTDRADADAELIRQIYTCALEHERWSALLAQLTHAFGSTYSVVMTQDRQTGLAAITATDVLPEERQRAYETHYGPRTPTLHYCHALPVGRVFTDEMYDDPAGYLRSEIYNDFFDPLDAHHLMFLQTRHDRREDKCVVLRRSRRAGPFERRHFRRFRRLGQHLCNAERVAARRRAVDMHERNLRNLLDELCVAALVADGAGRILYLTRQAEEVVRDGSTLRAVNGHLEARRGLESQLKAALRGCVASLEAPGMVESRALRVDQGPGGSPCTVLVSALLWRDDAGAQRPAALVSVNRARDRKIADPALLAELFDLTPAEGRVAAALCAGQTPPAYAAAAGISVFTARTLLKRVQEKTETHSQAALVGLLLGSTAGIVGPRQRLRKP